MTALSIETRNFFADLVLEPGTGSPSHLKIVRALLPHPSKAHVVERLTLCSRNEFEQLLSIVLTVQKASKAVRWPRRPSKKGK
jgi:hypothetical protein